MLDHKKSIALYRRLVPKTNWGTDVTEWSETGNCFLITRVCYIEVRCKTLTFKTMLSVKPFLWKWVLFAWKLKTILISMALQLASLWNRGLGSFRATRRWPILLVGAKDVIRYSEVLKSKITKLLERLQKLPFLGFVLIYWNVTE